MTKRQRRWLVRILPWLVTVGVFLIWQLACMTFDIPTFILPSPALIVKSLIDFHVPIMEHSWRTFATTLVGFGFAIVGGTALGIAIGASTLVYAGVYPVLIGLNSIPKVAIVPILVLWFGIGILPALITAFAISLFPIAVNVATGIATMEPEMTDVLRSMGATRWEVLRKVGIPRSLPYLFASLKVAITLAFVGSVLAETIGGNAGIGYMMMVATAQFDAPLVFSGLVAVATMAVGMYAACALLEGRMTRWAFRGQLIS